MFYIILNILLLCIGLFMTTSSGENGRKGVAIIAGIMSCALVAVIVYATATMVRLHESVQQAARSQGIYVSASLWYWDLEKGVSVHTLTPCLIDLTLDNGQLFIKSSHALATPEKLEALCKE